MYIDECVDRILKIFNSSIKVPINLESSQLVSINQLVSIVEKIAGVELERKYKLVAPLGVKGRNFDNSMIKSTLNWEPELSLEYGLTKTYNWIFNEMIKKGVEIQTRLDGSREILDIRFRALNNLKIEIL
jgi:GDP-D-mannose 3',5'-epimerase